MSVKIRLQRHGSKKRPFYFIVVANTTAPRDGKFIEKLGTYNPLTVPATVRISRERALHWLELHLSNWTAVCRWVSIAIRLLSATLQKRK